MIPVSLDNSADSAENGSSHLKSNGVLSQEGSIRSLQQSHMPTITSILSSSYDTMTTVQLPTSHVTMTTVQAIKETPHQTMTATSSTTNTLSVNMMTLHSSHTSSADPSSHDRKQISLKHIQGLCVGTFHACIYRNGGFCCMHMFTHTHAHTSVCT